MLDICIKIEFENGIKADETYFFRKRLVSRHKYEKERSKYSDKARLI